MAANYLPYDPGQLLLLPEAIQDWLPEGHLAHFISDTVDTLDWVRSTLGMTRTARATSRSIRP
jgi:hypothetical protein